MGRMRFRQAGCENIPTTAGMSMFQRESSAPRQPPCTPRSPSSPILLLCDFVRLLLSGAGQRSTLGALCLLS